MSIEILRKGFRLDIDPSQVVTFKKSQNLNGVQNRYAYSNTIKLEKTANNEKLLGLFYMPANKLTSLKDGYEVDVVFNRSINLRNQTLKIQKENLDTVDTYLLYTDSALVVALKELYVGQVAKKYTYNKTASAMIVGNALTETQPESGLYVIEEMPLLINLQDLMKDIFEAAAYSVYGDFFNDAIFEEFFVAPNEGTYQTFTGTPFAPTFDPDLDCYTFMKDVLTLFNCYVDVDDTDRTVSVNRWTNLGDYKNNFVDYSKHYNKYKDYAFQSQLAKKNDLKYSDSGTSYDSFFTNTLSSQDDTTYLNSNFGTGSLNIFENAEVEDGGTIPLRAEGEKGEISAVRILRKSVDPITVTIYEAGQPRAITALKATPVSMQTIFTEFHKDYTDFILTPIISNIEFNYNDILAASFSMTKVFFVEQTSSYWIPLEQNYSTKKDGISVKAMLVKKKKVESPTLYNLNSVLLDFKEKGTIPLDTFRDLYPMPPNKNDWQVVVFTEYNQDLNSLYVNDVLITADSLPQAFLMDDLVSLKIEANKASDTQPDTNSASIYFRAIDTAGGESNEAFINVVHTGVANLESNYSQTESLYFELLSVDHGRRYASPNVYRVGSRPNLNDTLQQTANVLETSVNDNLNLIEATQNYTGSVRVDFSAFTMHIRSSNNGIGKARTYAKVVVEAGSYKRTFEEVSTVNDEEETHYMNPGSVTFPNLPLGAPVRAYVDFTFDNRRGSNSGSMSSRVTITNFNVDISTTITL